MPDFPIAPGRRYALVTPCRNEADYMRRTLDSVAAQTVRPALWVIVDDGSTDATPRILAEYAARHDWIRVVAKPDRGHRAVGPGVIEAFYAGFDHVDTDAVDYICKLDLDLDLPAGYFAGLMDRMAADPRIGTASGKPWFRPGGAAQGGSAPRDAADAIVTSGMISEKCGDEMSVGMTKFYRTDCFAEIGGFVREVMWDAIDCHKARQLGWIACSWDAPDLAFEHLRPMGSSQSGVLTGRARHGFGQYYMRSDFAFFTASCLFRMAHPPYVLGGLASWWGYVKAWMLRRPQMEDDALAAFIRAYQRRALAVGKARATSEIVAARAPVWQARPARTGAGA
ncbi:glycosyl transferase, putative [Oceaniovalibus guishaninsula JLT2003]|uniref:Glycosyl transferase, putative n=1 Tax=Oceaniovalibus guishaninsula JLT2003 TaxID=1231392 RepID=K2H6J8_9RHOB|nr:glycosyltransferase [Oceaniovalibus guishaninsula]EKE43258.1 glycosyl transferase, putative [Oceaniovalibus guishaninsula JLT2003]